MNRGGRSRIACHDAEQKYENQVGEGDGGGELTESHIHRCAWSFVVALAELFYVKVFRLFQCENTRKILPRKN